MAESSRPPGGGGAGGEGLGRSRGGFTTKLHLSADGRCRPLSLIITPGQRADCTRFQPVLEKIRVPRLGPGRPRRKPDSLSADKAYGNGPCRQYLRRRGIRHTIPEKAESQAAACAKAHAALQWHFDQDVLAAEGAVDGWWALLTSIPAEQAEPNQRSTWFIQEEPVGVKWTWKRGCLPSHVLISAVLWVA
ncbi:transposase [Streptomyces sp. NPDC057543]|uniref:transposase n=1 Tax=Streptomyces sp. NPDC057543 TaxID=3346163 RepID=UPI003685A074